MLTLTLLYSDGIPVPNQQVMVRVCGRSEFGITDSRGHVRIPWASGESGKIIVNSEAVYLGRLENTQLVLPYTQSETIN